MGKYIIFHRNKGINILTKKNIKWMI